MAILIYSHSFCQKSVKKHSSKKYFFHISFNWKYLAWGLNRGLTSNKVTHYLLDTVITQKNNTPKKNKPYNSINQLFYKIPLE